MAPRSWTRVWWACGVGLAVGLAGLALRDDREARAVACDPNYTPCVPIDSDVDCARGRGNGPSYVKGPVRVVGRDIYGLDDDGDGTGCER